MIYFLFEKAKLKLDLYGQAQVKIDHIRMESEIVSFDLRAQGHYNSDSLESPSQFYREPNDAKRVCTKSTP